MAKSTDQPLPEKLAHGVFIVGLWLFGWSFLILAAQALLYLKKSAWPEWTLVDLLNLIDPNWHIQFGAWFQSSKDWYGLHKVILLLLSTLFVSPLALDTFILAFLVVWGGLSMGALREILNQSTVTVLCKTYGA